MEHKAGEVGWLGGGGSVVVFGDVGSLPCRLFGSLPRCQVPEPSKSRPAF